MLSLRSSPERPAKRDPKKGKGRRPHERRGEERRGEERRRKGQREENGEEGAEGGSPVCIRGPRVDPFGFVAVLFSVTAHQ
jgi:hypothetical protein